MAPADERGHNPAPAPEPGVGGLVPKTQTEYIRVIEVLLGHKNLDSSARTTLHAVKSLLGHLSPRRLPPD